MSRAVSLVLEGSSAQGFRALLVDGWPAEPIAATPPCPTAAGAISRAFTLAVASGLDIGRVGRPPTAVRVEVQAHDGGAVGALVDAGTGEELEATPRRRTVAEAVGDAVFLARCRGWRLLT